MRRLRARRAGSPDRRLAPRPLPAHLASAIGLWASSRAALPLLNNGWPGSSGAGKRLRALGGEIEALGTDRFAAALEREIGRRAAAYLAGLEAYRRHPFRRPRAARPVLWRAGTTRLLDYGADGDAPGVLIVPSLINRFYVVDLLPEHSFAAFLAARGLRPMIVDWAAPGRSERRFGLADYIAQRLEPALSAAAAHAGAPPAVLGYCMGGLLALVLALRHQDRVAGLALLATPWDFHAEQRQRARLLSPAIEGLTSLCDASDSLPVELIQFLFFLLDPFLAERKFVRFSELDPDGEAARGFVALEDWINDGVPLALGVARECARSWYGDNEPGRGRWRVGGEAVEPRLLRRPSLVVLPGRDRIVPPGSAAPLADALPGAEVLRPPLGHIGMMAAARAPALLWAPLADWLRARLNRAGPDAL